MERKDLLKIIRDYLGEYYYYRKVSENIKSLQQDGWSLDEIKAALDYWYGIKKNDPSKSNGGIRIIEYIREEANRYWENQNKKNKVLTSIPDYKEQQVETIVIQKTPMKKPTKIKLFELP